jgi:hypothetical protein
MRKRLSKGRKVPPGGYAKAAMAQERKIIAKLAEMLESNDDLARESFWHGAMMLAQELRRHRLMEMIFDRLDAET